MLLSACTGVPPLPPSRYGAVGGVVNGVVWTMGGVAEGQLLPEVWSYRLETGEWTRRPDAPDPFAFGGALWDGNAFVVVAGRVPTGVAGTVWRFDPEVQSWTDLAPHPSPRERFGMVDVGGSIYTSGGIDAAGIPLGDSWRYAAGQWEVAAADLGIGGIYGHSLAATDEGFAWQVGGLGTGGEWLYTFGGSSVALTDFGTGVREGGCAHSVGTTLWVWGGNAEDALADSWENGWQEVDSVGPDLRAHGLCAGVSDSLYILGGLSLTTGATLADMWRLRDGLWKQILDTEGGYIPD